MQHKNIFYHLIMYSFTVDAKETKDTCACNIVQDMLMADSRMEDCYERREAYNFMSKFDHWH